MSIADNHAPICAQILRARGKMMRLLGLFQQAGWLFTTEALLVEPGWREPKDVCLRFLMVRVARRRRSAAMIEMKRFGSGRQGLGVRKPAHRRLLVIIGTLVVIAALIGGYFIVTWLYNRPNTNPLLKVVPANQSIVQQVTGVSQSTVQAVGTGGLPNPLKYIQEQPFLQGPHGYPEFFFAGAQFCQ